MKPAEITAVRGDGNREVDARGKRSGHQARMTMERFKAYKLTETPDRKIRARVRRHDARRPRPGRRRGARRLFGRQLQGRARRDRQGQDPAAAIVHRRHRPRREPWSSSTDPRFKKGDAVLGIGFDLGVSHHGGYAQYARMPGDWLVKLPQGISLWDAMAFGTAGFTAGIAIVRMEHERPQAGQRPGDRERRHRRRRLDRPRRARASSAITWSR